VVDTPEQVSASRLVELQRPWPRAHPCAKGLGVRSAERRVRPGRRMA
jgi:hypothetical protein